MPTILVVEDDPQVRETLIEFMHLLGHAAFSARSAAEARSLLADHAVHLVVSDCAMQGEPGASLAEHSRALGIPVILTTGHPDYLESLGELPFVVLRKPFRLDDLEPLIAAALQPAA
jgi:two-component system, OmpR family, response regulator